MSEESKNQKVKINGKEYDVNALSDNAKAQLQSLMFTDSEIKRLQRQIAVVQTAQGAYQQALAADLPIEE